MAENTVETHVAPTPEGQTHAPAKGQADATRDDARYLTPAVDIHETETGLTVVADMPGVAPNGVDVRVEDNVLTIRGKVEGKLAGSELFGEYRLHDYFRQFKLNERIDQEKIAARLTHGVLHVELPRAQAAKPRRVKVAVG